MRSAFLISLTSVTYPAQPIDDGDDHESSSSLRNPEGHYAFGPLCALE